MSSAERELMQERHAQWKEDNLRALRASGVPFEERPEACLFRVPGKPLVDFYPSTGRWRVVAGKRKTFRGGAVAFLVWYAKQGGPEPSPVELAAALLLRLGFVPDGATREEEVLIPTRRSPVYGGLGGERRTLGGRTRFALPGTAVRVTVGARTISVYQRGPGGIQGVRFLGDNLQTKGFTAAQLQQALAGVAVLPAVEPPAPEAPPQDEPPPVAPPSSADGFEVVVDLAPAVSEEGR